VTKSVKVSFVKDDTSEAEATAAPSRPSATVVKVRMLAILYSSRSAKVAARELERAAGWSYGRAGTYLFNTQWL
jgi:hypothetical protein